MSRNDLSRRRVLQGLAQGAFATTLPTWFLKESRTAELEIAAQRHRHIGPNDTISVGLIGSGGPRGGYRQGFGDAMGIRNHPGVKLVAVCDVDAFHLNWAAEQFGPGTAKYKDYRDLLKDRNIDAVVIGTPDHWHSKIAIDAMNAGKDVYCEKPLTLTIAQGREIVKASRKNGAVFQTGSQQRSDQRFRMACELVRNGRLGKIKRVIAHLPTGPTGGPFDPQTPPADFDWNMWLGPAPMTDYLFERTHGNFRWWLDYSGGMLTDWGAHHNDIAQWGLGMDGSGPISVSATGKNQPIVGSSSYSTFPEFEVLLEYPGDIVLNVTNTGENGVQFEGEGGWIFVSRSRIGASEQHLLDDPLPSSATHLEVSNDHHGNFVDCVRSRKDPICHAEVGHRSVSVCHLCNISLRLGGRKMAWDPKAERFPVDGIANTMLDRPARKWD